MSRQNAAGEQVRKKLDRDGGLIEVPMLAVA